MATKQEVMTEKRESKSALFEKISPETAEHYLSFNESNRTQAASRILSYANQMAGDKWVENGETIKFDQDGMLIDGQNRLMAIVRAGKENPGFEGVEMLVVRGLPPVAKDTVDQGKPRSMGDLFKMNRIPNASKVSSTVNRYLDFHSGRVGMNGRTGTGRNRHASARTDFTRRDLLDTYWKHQDEFQMCASIGDRSIIGCRRFRHAELAGLAAYLVIDLNKEASQVEAFLSMIGRGYNAHNGFIWLCNRIDTRKELTGMHVQCLIAKAWNKWQAGIEFKQVSWNETEGKVEFL